jgi:hypothetical protein
MFTILAATVLSLPAPPIKVSEPIWLISPRRNDENCMTLKGYDFGRSNNNVAIKIFNDRLYLAVRTAPHHHPRPPLWAPEDATSLVRLTVWSAPCGPGECRALLSGKAVDWKWRLELEVGAELAKSHFAGLKRDRAGKEDGKRREAERTIESLFGKPAVNVPVDGYLKGSDFREPVFYELDGQLHLLFMQIAGVSMKFEPLRAWHMQRTEKGWSAPTPALAPGEHFWDVVVRTVNGRAQAYLTLTRGGHYEFGAGGNGLVDLRCSNDGRVWKSVAAGGAIDRGRACEPALGFAADGSKAWMLLRCEDADRRGWGSLLGWADARRLEHWTFPDRADPRRFDSARFLSSRGQIYVVARQRLARVKSATGWNLADNAAYGPGTRPRKAGADLQSMLLMASYGASPMRTAVYRLNEGAGRLDLVLTLPSAGDTAFPSIERLDRRTFLIANYSSAPEQTGLSWLEGQNRRTGVYLLILRIGSE